MLVLYSDPRNVAKVEPFIEEIVDKYHVRPEVYGNILITLTEAVTNAIVHGNHSDERKTVQVKTQKHNGMLAFVITDEGPGFDHSNLPDPTAPENILKIGGRGVFLMRQLSDNVSFHDNGSTVEIHFNI